MPWFHQSNGAAGPRCTPSFTSPRRTAIEPEQTAQQASAARSQKTGDAEYLAAVQRKRSGGQAIGCEPFNLQQRVANQPWPARIQIVQRAAHHHGDDAIGGRLRCDALTRVAPVAQHDKAIGHLGHFLDEVRNVDNRKPLPLKPANQLEKFSDVAVRQAARRLVEHKYATAARKGARDLYQLLRRRSELADGRVDGNIGMTELFERCPRGAAHHIAIDDA